MASIVCTEEDDDWMSGGESGVWGGESGESGGESGERGGEKEENEEKVEEKEEVALILSWMKSIN